MGLRDDRDHLKPYGAIGDSTVWVNPNTERCRFCNARLMPHEVMAGSCQDLDPCMRRKQWQDEAKLNASFDAWTWPVYAFWILFAVGVGVLAWGTGLIHWVMK